MYDQIVFDLDGTLYDISNILLDVYETQISFLCDELLVSHNKAEQLLSQNHIYPQIRKDSKSATSYFGKMGLNINRWKKYREDRFDVGKINKNTAAKGEDLIKISKVAPIILVSSNTSANVKKVLAHIGIDEGVFVSVISSDFPGLTNHFNKKQVFENLRGKLLSIGDRYETDVFPMLQIGGHGILVEGPGSVSRVAEDLVMGFYTMKGYRLFRGFKV